MGAADQNTLKLYWKLPYDEDLMSDGGFLGKGMEMEMICAELIEEGPVQMSSFLRPLADGNSLLIYCKEVHLWRYKPYRPYTSFRNSLKYCIINFEQRSKTLEGNVFLPIIFLFSSPTTKFKIPHMKLHWEGVRSYNLEEVIYIQETY